ncbi:MAG: hypothetical protein ACREFO_07950 [Acetobacteraceae bacterium]
MVLVLVLVMFEHPGNLIGDRARAASGPEFRRREPTRSAAAG